MSTQPLSFGGLKLQSEAKPNESIIHCNGKIIAENLAVFESEIRDLMPESRDPIAAIARRIVLDLSNVTYVDSSGLGALLGVWTAARDKGCDLEIANLNPRVEKLVEMTKLDTVFKRGRIVAEGGSAPCVNGALTALDPDEACQQAIDAGMVVHRVHPLNCETSIPALIGGVVVAFSQTDFTEDLKKITVPVIVMHSEDDQIVPYVASGPLSAKLLKNGTLKTYKDFPHGMPTTQADTINADLLAFLKQGCPEAACITP
jgi:anti-anti-sigma factor